MQFNTAQNFNIKYFPLKKHATAKAIINIIITINIIMEILQKYKIKTQKNYIMM